MAEFGEGQLSAEDTLRKLLGTLTEVTEAVAQLAREVRSEKKMVETLFAASYGMKWPTADMLQVLKAAYVSARDAAPEIEKPIIDQHIARIDELLQVDQTGAKPTVH